MTCKAQMPEPGKKKGNAGKKNEGKKLANETNEFFHYKKNEGKKLANEASQKMKGKNL